MDDSAVIAPRPSGVAILPRLLAGAAAHGLGLARLQRIHDELAGTPGDLDRWLEACLRWLDLRVDLPPDDLARVPATGGLLVVAEHPTGVMEGLLLLTLLRRQRRDVKVLANRALGRLPALAGAILPIDVDNHGNVGAVRAAVRHLRAGGALLAFPAGEVAWRRLGCGRRREAQWQPTLAGIQRLAQCTVVPVHVAADNPAWFHLAGSVHRRLRTALLARAFLWQRHRPVALRFGHPILPPQIERFGADDRARIDYLRLRTGILARRAAPPPMPASLPSLLPIAARRDAAELAREVRALPPSARLLRSGSMHVLVATAGQLPLLLPEIGRLRELTFRGVGEGSGNSRDLDRFDVAYRHLFVWDDAERQVVGAYRLGLCDELLAGGGPAALYTNGFYEFAPAFWPVLGPALELGRSFVQPRYQKGYSPLLLLWRGIGAFVARHPRYRRLFGTVSISADHHATSIQLMVDHLDSHCRDRELAPLVRSRRPWRAARGSHRGPRWHAGQIAELQDVSAMVRELEVGRAGVPILLEQYLKLGARMLGISVDRAFHTIDALVVVDLLAAPPQLQRRYLGDAGIAALRDHHGAAPAPGVV